MKNIQPRSWRCVQCNRLVPGSLPPASCSECDSRNFTGIRREGPEDPPELREVSPDDIRCVMLEDPVLEEGWILSFDPVDVSEMD